MTRYQVANCYMGRAGLINSGGASAGESDLKEAVKTAVINKRAGGMGLISGRKAFQRPMQEGVGIAERDSGCVPDKRSHGRVGTGEISHKKAQKVERDRPPVATRVMVAGPSLSREGSVPGSFFLCAFCAFLWLISPVTGYQPQLF